MEDQAAASSTAAPQQRGKQQEEGEEEEEEGLAGCGPALLRVLLTALIAPRGVWMRRERDLMEALGRVTQVSNKRMNGRCDMPVCLNRFERRTRTYTQRAFPSPKQQILARDGQPLGLLLPPPPTQAAQEEAGSPGKPLAPTSSTIPAASSRRSSRRRSAAKSDDAVAPAPAAAGATNDVPPAPVAAAPAPAAGIVLGGDAGLCRRVMAAALALCGEVQVCFWCGGFFFCCRAAFGMDGWLRTILISRPYRPHAHICIHRTFTAPNSPSTSHAAPRSPRRRSASAGGS